VRVAHFDCFSGISGDMTLAALFDAGVPADPVLAGIASLGLPIKIEIEKVRKGGFAATQIHVQAPAQDEERHLSEVEEILSRGKLTEKQRDLALAIFRRLAQAEAKVHSLPVERIHFHEVGALDSIADIAGAAIALDLLGVEKFSSGSVPTGSGSVKCAHGIMPVPTPATAELLKGVPLRTSPIKSELTTPTGAAILTTIVTEWIEAPAMAVEKIGIGAGTRDFMEQPNILRIFVGEVQGPPLPDLEQDTLWVLETNLDNVPGEVIGYCMERLFQAGALDVYSTAIQMKKNRPGVKMTVLAPTGVIADIEGILFQETGTLGIRRHQVQREKLHRKTCTVETVWGDVKGKLSWRDGQPPRFTPEFEDCARIAREHQRPLAEIFQAAQQAYFAKSR
jgi:uncharacterized protein (TIGR00299 family) protein